MINKNIVNIHGKDYLTVAGRVELAHQDLKDGLTIATEMVRASDKGILFKATVRTPKGEFNGHSYAAFSSQGITGQSPIEVAETSAIGRALGFAGYGIVEGMATADEVVKSEKGVSKVEGEISATCSDCGKKIPEAVNKFSISRIGRALCYDCQKADKEAKEAGLTEPAKEEVSDDLPF